MKSFGILFGSLSLAALAAWIFSALVVALPTSTFPEIALFVGLFVLAFLGGAFLLGCVAILLMMAGAAGKIAVDSVTSART